MFVSHTLPDAERIKTFLLPALSENCRDFHFENAKTQGSEVYKPYINRSANRCKWFLVCISSNVLLSKWVRVEVEIALILKSLRHILAVKLDDTEPDSLDSRLRGINRLALTDDQTTNARELARMLAS